MLCVCHLATGWLQVSSCSFVSLDSRVFSSSSQPKNPEWFYPRFTPWKLFIIWERFSANLYRKKTKPVLKRFFSVKLLLPKGSRTWVNTFGNKQRTVFVTLFVCCVFVVVCFVCLLRVCGLSAKVKPQRSRKIDPKLPWCLNVILGPILQVHGALCGHGAGG